MIVIFLIHLSEKDEIWLHIIHSNYDTHEMRLLEPQIVIEISATQNDDTKPNFSDKRACSDY